MFSPDICAVARPLPRYGTPIAIALLLLTAFLKPLLSNGVTRRTSVARIRSRAPYLNLRVVTLAPFSLSSSSPRQWQNKRHAGAVPGGGAPHLCIYSQPLSVSNSPLDSSVGEYAGIAWRCLVGFVEKRHQQVAWQQPLCFCCRRHALEDIEERHHHIIFIPPATRVRRVLARAAQYRPRARAWAS